MRWKIHDGTCQRVTKNRFRGTTRSRKAYYLLAEDRSVVVGGKRRSLVDPRSITIRPSSVHGGPFAMRLRAHPEQTNTIEIPYIHSLVQTIYSLSSERHKTQNTNH